MEPRIDENKPIDFSNPQDPRVKKFMQDLQVALAAAIIDQVEQYKIIEQFYLTKEKEKELSEIEKKAAKEMSTFMESLQKQAVEAVKNPEKEKLETCLKEISLA